MKKLFFLLIAGMSQWVYGQGNFTLNGKLVHMPEMPEQVILIYSRGGERINDTSTVTDGNYVFTGSVSEPVMALLMVSYAPKEKGGPQKAMNMERDMANVFIEPAMISVTSQDSLANIQVSGSLAHDAYMDLRGKLKSINEQQRNLNREYSALYQKKDEEGMKKLEADFRRLEEQAKEIYRAYLVANPQSPIAIFALQQFAGWDIDPEKVQPLFDQLPEKVKQLASARELSVKIEAARKTSIGQQAIDFTQNDTSGYPVTLSSYRGKYILIDFWASWCGPCRAENPNVVSAYDRFRDKGFHIIGVSLDQPNGKDKWLKAIHDDKLTWTQVSDLKFWKNEVAVQYGIQAIPQNFLLDPTGKIIAKNLRGEELTKKLETLFQVN